MDSQSLDQTAGTLKHLRDHPSSQARGSSRGCGASASVISWEGGADRGGNGARRVSKDTYLPSQIISGPLLR
jgi:hypothetical protein